jgi:predicted AlkP superfamily pyrophosphatase or phosphodiesterase
VLCADAEAVIACAAEAAPRHRREMGMAMLRVREMMAAVLLLVFCVLPLPTRVGAQPAAKPKLVVFIAVDQMRADYLERYAALYDKGLKRLTQNGAWFKKAAYPYLNTVTCAGHSTLGTGTFPYKHGMVLNQWYERESDKTVTCNQDSSESEVSYDRLSGPGDSAKRMQMPTLAELMRRTLKGRVVTMSIKPRSAIGLAGHEGDSVTWLDERGAWETSTAYSKTPAPWLAAFIKGNPITRDAGKVWERTLPENRYQYSDDGVGEGKPNGWSTKFPHPLGAAGDAAYLAHWMQSPFANDYLGEMAEAAIDALHLGKGDGVDFLGVSFSSLDIVGHAYGPRSHEVQDVLVRLDATLGKLLAYLDENVGESNYVLALSADHGVGDIPEQISNGGRQASTVIAAAVEAALKPLLGGGPFVEANAYTDVYLKTQAAEKLKSDPRVFTAIRDALMRVSGIARVLKGDELASQSARASNDPQIRAAALSYFAGRSGDIIIIPKENWLLAASVTTHGTLYPYDQRVPVLFFGAGIRPVASDDPATPADIAATLASIVGVHLPSPDGQVLKSALR